MNSNIINSYARVNGNISSSSNNVAHAGGLVGKISENSNVNTSYAQVENDISSIGRFSAYAGGLVGEITGGAISNSYARNSNISSRDSSSVDSSTFAGGLGGRMRGDSEIANTYATSNAISSTGRPFASAGGLVGATPNSNLITGSYYNAPNIRTTTRDEAGNSRSQLQLGCPTMPDATCEGATTYSGWNSRIWNFGNDRTPPTLRH